MSLKHSYTLIAPAYDAIIRRPLAGARRRSLAALPVDRSCRILIAGIGTGLDLPYLPKLHKYVGIDLTAAMLRRARSRIASPDTSLVQGDCQRLPFRNECFDHAILHLIVAVVPDGAALLLETARVLRPAGKVFLLDKFLRRGQLAPARRLINLLSRHVATRTDVVFEQLIENVPQLRVEEDEPVLLGGWFRVIQLEKCVS
ncbi:MAG TPA: class I SAM-dependent methyltransferase [Burkholderiales bacterium]|jgi:ubiquinone/menaquinone biosynthesis C-methylase UbiE|nr:class I SAM-dependent methyltransferase [Burkholderiales bacterium]